MKISWFNNGFSEVSEDLTIAEIVAKIKSIEFQKQIETCHQIVRQHGKKHPDYDAKKKNLPFFTPSGTFEKSRKSENLREYSNMMMLDIDDLSSESEVLEVKELASLCPFTWMAFVSPSGIGLKIWVKVANTAFEHKPAFQKLLFLYENFLRTSVDKSGSDVSRTCFISHDPHLYLNEQSEIFDFKTAQLLNSPRSMNAQYIQDSIKFCIEFTQRNVIFEDGNRNSFVFRLACNMNRYGVPVGHAESALIAQFIGLNFTENEIERTIKSAYKNIHEYGKYSFKGKTSKTSDQGFDRASRAAIYRELGIAADKIMEENQFAKILLYAHLVDDTGESLLKFACEKLGELLPDFEDPASREVLELLLLPKIPCESDLKNHASSGVSAITSEVLNGTWLPPETYVSRLEICRFKISKCAETIKRSSLQSRYSSRLIIDQSLRTLEDLNRYREIWLKELDSLLQDWKAHRC